MSTLSTHVLDTALGQPARGVRIALEREGRIVGVGTTDDGGRIRDLAGSGALAAGVYRLIFHAGEYFARDGRDSFWTSIVVEFRIADDAGHHHVPLLLSPFGYSTYRGS